MLRVGKSARHINVDQPLRPACFPVGKRARIVEAATLPVESWTQTDTMSQRIGRFDGYAVGQIDLTSAPNQERDVFLSVDGKNQTNKQENWDGECDTRELPHHFLMFHPEAETSEGHLNAAQHKG